MMQTRKLTTGRKGFTLIELLVVIAIIAILAAILFPVFHAAKEKARSAACLSYIKQLAFATQMYLDDWDRWYPLRVAIDDQRDIIWDDALLPYYVSGPYDTRTPAETLPVCPSFAADRKPVAGSPVLATECYGPSWLLFGGNPYGTSINYQYSKHETSVSIPAKCAMWLEDPGAFTINARMPHNNGQNVAFCDGHAKWYSMAPIQEWTGSYQTRLTYPPMANNIDPSGAQWWVGGVWWYPRLPWKPLM